MTIENRNLFASTDGYVFAARLLEDGREIWHADYRFDVAAGDTQHHDIAFPDIDSARARCSLFLAAAVT